MQTVDTINFAATVTDNMGVDTVYVEYKVNESGASGYIGLKPNGKGRFENFLNVRTFSLEEGDSLKYRIYAYDKALAPNMSVLPESDYFSVPVKAIGSVVSKYSTDFTDAASDFINDGFEIAKPSGFSNNALHTVHPYKSPGESGDSIGYISILRYPVKFDPSGITISFNEIVLVEPGEDGSVYGSSDFYDYVIVEGSINFGKSWFKLVDGYDSRLVASWKTAYNSSIVGQNSTFTGNESMYKPHTINLSASSVISAGDTLLIRFRLFSDPYANGWGWAIDDLQINPVIDAVEDLRYEPDVIYPNPGKGLIKIQQNLSQYENGKPFHFSVFNSTGTCIKDEYTSGDSGTLVDISGSPAGIYIIILIP